MDICENCRAELSESGGAPPADACDVARVSSLAEAGYLTGLLGDEGLPVWVRQHDEFNAVTGNWSCCFILQAKQSDSARVAATLRREAGEIAQEERDEVGEAEYEPFQRVLWRPVALMTLAGVASFWLGQRVAQDRGPTGPEQLAAAMGQADGPFVARGEGLTRRQLTFDPLSRSWRLETDADGDGRIDSRRWFSLDD